MEFRVLCLRLRRESYCIIAADGAAMVYVLLYLDRSGCDAPQTDRIYTRSLPDNNVGRIRCPKLFPLASMRGEPRAAVPS